MGLLDYKDMVCGWCESTNIGMIPLATVSVEGPALVFPLAHCRDCGAPFVPPEEAIAEKREEWGKAIREAGRAQRMRKKAARKSDAPAVEKPKDPPPKKKSGGLDCEKCGRKMTVKNQSSARYTQFVLWECTCGHEHIQKKHEGDDFSEEDPLDPEDIPEVRP
jgi:hypothetical protein